MTKKKQPKVTEKRWHPRVRAFLAAYRESASITKAAKAAGISRRAHYRKLETSPAYKAEFESATVVAADVLEDEAIRRAVDGVIKPLIYHGDLVRVPKDPNDPESELVTVYEVERSDALMQTLLKRFKPALYKDHVEHSGAVTNLKFEGTFEELLAMYREMTIKKKEGDEE